MICPKCSSENTDVAQFCKRCHTPLRYICPACKHVQLHGGKCDQCGVDFLKYAMTLVSQSQGQAELDRQRKKSRAAMVKQIVLLPITGGWSLLKYLKDLARGD
jgi:double zinc ribbon protein